MDPRNYRLGNLLREVNSGKIVEVIGLEKSEETRHSPDANVLPLKMINYKIEVSGSFPDRWQAEEIPISPDILEYLGFIVKNTMEGYAFYKQNLCFVHFNHEVFIWQNSKIEFIHQVQNIYFLIHGKELDVSSLKPKPIPKS